MNDDNLNGYKNLYYQSPISIIVCDFAFIIKESNLQVSQLTGFARNELMGKSILTILETTGNINVKVTMVRWMKNLKLKKTITDKINVLHKTGMPKEVVVILKMIHFSGKEMVMVSLFE